MYTSVFIATFGRSLLSRVDKTRADFNHSTVRVIHNLTLRISHCPALIFTFSVITVWETSLTYLSVAVR